jgi:hypothetical protein
MSAVRIRWLFLSLFVLSGNQTLSGETPASIRGDFHGRFLAVACKGKVEQRIVMTDVEVRSLGTKSFIVGKVLDIDGEARAGQVTTWLAVDEVGRIREFQDLMAARAEVNGKSRVEKPTGDTSDGVCEWTSRSMKIPIDYNPGKKADIEKLRLFVSDDQGKTWQKTDECGTDASYFKYTAPHDGDSWFCLQVEGKDGKKDPPDTALIPALKVRFVAPLVVPPILRDPDDIPRRIEPARIYPSVADEAPRRIEPAKR